VDVFYPDVFRARIVQQLKWTNFSGKRCLGSENMQFLFRFRMENGGAAKSWLSSLHNSSRSHQELGLLVGRLKRSSWASQGGSFAFICECSREQCLACTCQNFWIIKYFTLYKNFSTFNKDSANARGPVILGGMGGTTAFICLLNACSDQCGEGNVPQSTIVTNN